MSDKIKNIINDTLSLAEKGEGKVLDLKDAVARYIKPGMQLHLGDGCNSTAREIIRQFWGQKPGFTVIGTGIRDYGADLLHCGLVDKLIIGAFAESYPQQSVSRIMQRAFKEKRVKIENWSLYSIIQRLMAGALGTGFMPTKSIVGTTMAQENGSEFREIQDPFDSGKTVGIVKSLNPDVALVHGWAADRNGNTILAPDPWSGGQGMWAAFASKGGAIVTVDKLVSADLLRQHQSLVKIPGYLVSSVSVVPFGAHPQASGNPSVGNLPSYGADYNFITEHRRASQKPETLDKWLKSWVMDCPTQADYLRKLGYERLVFLKGKAQRDSWELLLETFPDEMLTEPPANNTEIMILAAARKLSEVAMKNHYRLILTAIGTAALAAWLSYYDLKRQGYDAELSSGTGLYGFTPPFADPYAWYNIGNLPTCKMLTDTVIAYGVFVAGSQSKCISILGAGQIDKHGNGNSSRAPDGSYLIGSGGSNDAANAPLVFIMAKQSRDRFVERVPYVTFPGNNVKVLISDKAIFDKPDGSDELILTGYFQREKATRDQIIMDIKQNCSWDLKMAPNLIEIPAPTREELLLLRLLDPAANFRGD